MSSYRKLKVWQMSFELAENIYKLTTQLPPNERFGLVSQMQRSVISIPSNIAEGQQRGKSKEFKQFLGFSRGSAAELSTQLLLTQKIYKINTDALVQQTEEVQKMLYVLQSKL